MSVIKWLGGFGDWNDPANWSTNLLPATTDEAYFGPNVAATVVGSAYIGSLLIDGASVEFSGEFGSADSSLFTVTDLPTSTHGTLDVDAWGQLLATDLTFSTTDVRVEGLLASHTATLANVQINGPAAKWLSTSGTINGTLDVLNGGSVVGNETLSDGSQIRIDRSAALLGGILTISGLVTMSLQDTSAAVSDVLDLSAGSVLTIQATTPSQLDLHAGISGTGKLALDNVTLIVGAATQSGGGLGSSGGFIGDGPPGASFELQSANLDLSAQPASRPSVETVDCRGINDTITAGIDALMVTSSAKSLTFLGSFGSTTIFSGDGAAVVTQGSGAMTVQGGLGLLTVTGGSGDLVVWNGGGLNDSILGSSGANTIIGGNGATIIGSGSVASVYGDSGTNALIDASGSSANNTLFAGDGQGVTTLRGGSGSDRFLGGSTSMVVYSGLGPDQVWCGNSPSDTVYGGTSGDIIGAGPAAQIVLSGPNQNVVISQGKSTLIDNRSASGTLAFFAVGSGTTSLLGGSGSEVGSASATSLSLNANGGTMTVYGDNAATVSASGHLDLNFFASGTGCIVDARAATGSGTYFGSANGTTVMDFGSGDNTAIVAGGAVTVNASAGSNTIFGGTGSLQINLDDVKDVGSVLTVSNYNPAIDTFSFTDPQQMSVVAYGGGTELIDGNQIVYIPGYFGQPTLG